MIADLLLLAARGMLVASIAILVVLALRGPARARFGAGAAYTLWLLVPGAVAASYVPARIIEVAEPALAPGVATTSTIGPVAGADIAGDMAASWPGLATVVLLVWLTGFAASLGLLLVDQWRVVRRLGLKPEGAFYRASRESAGPAVIGIFAPRIVVPLDFEQRYNRLERTLVLEHERAHLRAGDTQVNALAALAQCLNWFNPLFYIARKALRIDQELACDERVMRRYGRARRAYAEAMLKTQLASRALPLGCHWPASGAQPLKQRIAMLKRPAPPPAARLIGLVACLGLVGGGGVAAWAAQPPRLAYAEQAPARATTPQAAALGRRLVEEIGEGHGDQARALIDAGADVNFLLVGDGTPLIGAVREDDLDLARRLIAAGADVNGAAPGDGNPLIVAADRGRMPAVALLVEAGADVNAYVPGDETPLINAARENRLEAARFLIARGADVNLAVDAPTLNGVERRSPLGMARRGGHDEMERLLRSHGARP